MVAGLTKHRHWLWAAALSVAAVACSETDSGGDASIPDASRDGGGAVGMATSRQACLQDGDCGPDAFCDRTVCAVPRSDLRQGVDLGSLYGVACPDYDPASDARNASFCGVHVCLDGLCRSCIEDSDCCRNPSGCSDPSASACVVSEEVGTNICVARTSL